MTADFTAKDEQEFLDGIGTWHSENHHLAITPKELKKKYLAFMASRDLDYIAARNRLIPEAVKVANKKFGVIFKGGAPLDRDEWIAAWNRAYHTTMNKLWGERDGKTNTK
jgi:hypothetical protein